MATLLTKRSNTAASVPLAAQLTNSSGGAELAVNTADKRLFTKDGSGNVVELGTAPSSLAVTNSVTVGGSLVASTGAAGTPSITASGDTNTGLFFPAADTVAVATGGTERVRVTSAGDVGIGTSSPLAKLNVVTSGGKSTIAIGDTAASTYSQLLMYGGSGKYNWSIGAQYNADNAFEITPSTATGGTTFSTPSFVITSSGNVGIGTSSPNYSLTAYKAGATATYLQVANGATGAGAANGLLLGVDTSGNGVISAQGSVNLNINVAGLQRATIDSAGNVGIGTSSPNAKVDAYAASNFVGVRASSGSNFLTLYANSSGTQSGLYTDNANPIIFWNSGTERARIDSSGRLLVGKTSAGDFVTGVEMQPAGAVLAYRASSVAGIFGRTDNGETVRFTNNGNTVGTISTTGSATAYNTSSDYRLKHDIAPMTGALAKVAALKPVTYKWNVDDSAGEGFIAHELQEVCPDAVTGEKDATRMEQYEISPAVPATYDEEGNELTPAVEAVMGEREVPVYQGIDTSFLVATLAAAIQELKAIVDQQAVEIAALKGQA